MTGEDIAVAAHEHAVEAAAERPALGLFERFLTVWVALCIIIGIGLGHFFPEPFQAIAGVEMAKVNLPVAGLIWLMIIPMLLKIDLGALHQVKEHWRGIGVTLFINWAVKPLPWRCWAGCSSAGCSGRGCRKSRWLPISPA